eukprot:TRINITY_DN61401_c0_g1_i1.p1 TRINITY_DN61401_c0_g1~~TRINITY_DN61401_c0_g1_i1.p1  ORF type:complete len:427 (-),score=29.14 TRINITY_DN61401_c0_g1_i1:1199-2479(-)
MIVIFSGGSGMASVAEALKLQCTDVSYILPVTDDGGSSAEITKVLGGPSIGDIRNRLLRLVDPRHTSLQTLLRHRLPSSTSEAAEEEWLSLLSGQHPLWAGIPAPCRTVVQRFLTEFNVAVAGPVPTPLVGPHPDSGEGGQAEKFCFVNGSVGNFFLTGARLYFNSLQAAIFMFAQLTAVPPDTKVIPVCCDQTRDSSTYITIGVQLANGDQIVGQNCISHPTVAHMSTSEHKLAPQPQLPAPIDQLFYVRRKRSDISLQSCCTSKQKDFTKMQPDPNPEVIQLLKTDSIGCIVFGVGSLYTSLIASLVVKGVGEAIATSPCTTKVLMLPGWTDRETNSMAACDIVEAVVRALNRYGELENNVGAYITHVVYPDGVGKQFEVQTLPPSLTVCPVGSHSGATERVSYDETDVVAHLLRLKAGAKAGV